MKNQQIIFHKVAFLVGALIASATLVFCASIAVYGQSVSLPSPSDENASGNSVHGITFPVVELGNCANKNECKDYCNQSANMDACIAFAKDHGLMTQTEATHAGKFGKLVRAGSGPGGCDSPESCNVYCSTVSHLDECTAFAEKNGFKGDQYEHGKKIQAFLKSGGTTPGNCQTKEECQTYCGDFSHAKECFEFAQKAGIAQNGNIHGAGGTSSTTQMAKFAEAAQNGETPGGCTTKDECEKYCSDATHREECVNFGVKIGFIKPEQADMAKETGGKGPGGCDSQESCKAYCNDQSHHEECFKFAEDRGFITHEESAKTQEGLVRARQGFENAPPEVQGCLKSALGENILDDIQSGKLVPGTDVSTAVRGCFEKFGKNVRPQESFKNVPPDITACLKEKFGDDFDKIRTGKASTTPEMGGLFRECFRGGAMNTDHSQVPPFKAGERGTTTEGRRNPFLEEQGGQNGPEGNQGKSEQLSPSLMMGNMLRSAPPEVAACIKEKFPDGFPGMGTGGTAQLTPEIKDKIRGCFESFRPTPQGTTKPMGGMPPQGMGDRQKEGFGSSTGEEVKPPFGGQVRPTGGFITIPPEVQACVRDTVGAENFDKLQTAPASLELIGVIRTCLEKVSNSGTGGMLSPSELQPINAGGAPMTFLERLIGAALLPLRWVFGK